MCHTADSCTAVLSSQRTAIVDQAAGTGMINPYGQSQLPELTRELVHLVEVEFRQGDQFAYVWRQRAFIAWEKESVRKSKKTLHVSYFPISGRQLFSQSVGASPD